jgi:cysteine desulfurase NifS
VSATTEKPAICGICPAGCWVRVTLDENGRISRVRADDSSDLGMICTLGQHSAEIVHSPDRIKTPLKRLGKKGNFEFQPITWDEAYDNIVSKLRSIKEESGPEATAIYTGRGSFELSLCDIFQPQGVAVSSACSVLFPFGSPNTLGVGALCYVSFAMIAPHVTMGGMLINMFSDLENANLIVVWGANPATDCPPHNLDRILAARRRGAEVVVIDPRRTATAKLTGADWVPIRPGTDGALALGMCNVLITEELHDEKFVEEWVHGFDDFARYAQHYRPELVEQITGVPADTIVSLARRIADVDGVAPVMYSGLEYSDSGVQAIRATQVLWALAGQLDVPGGHCFSMRQNLFRVNRDGLVANPDAQNAFGRDRFPVYSQYRGESHAIALPEAVLRGNPFKVRSLIILGGSIITSWPQPEVWRQTLGALDFLVTIDRQLTADAAYADIVLPATTGFEISSYMTYGPIFRLREKIVEPIGEARNDYFILAELAKRLGYGHLYPQTEEEVLEYVLKGTGFTPDEVRRAGGMVQRDAVLMQYKKWEKGALREDGKPGFETPTGRFEISSTILEEHGYEGLPIYTEPTEGPLAQPELAREYPLVFNSGARVTTDFRSQFHGIPGLSRKRPEPTVSIHREDAQQRGIVDGDEVEVRTQRGAVKMRALVTEDLVKGAIEANMGGGGPIGPKAWQECNINKLTDLQHYDPISGFPVYKTLLCEVERIGSTSRRIAIDSGEVGELALGEVDVSDHDESQHGTRETSPLQPPPRQPLTERIYLDHNATTPIAPEVRQLMHAFIDDCHGNPSSIHADGKAARFEVEAARRKVAQLLNCTAGRITFTGGGSEANNLALKGIAFSEWGRKRRHLVTSNVEHPAILSTCRWLEKTGYRITYLEADRDGRIHPDDLASAITNDTCLVSIMTANNETGTLQPIQVLAQVAHERGVLFHTDAVQAVGKIPVDVKAWDVDLLTLSGHKFHGPKGVGALYVSRNVELESLVHGGSQENRLRAGTENVLGIVGLGRAAELAIQRLPDMQRVARLRNRLEAMLGALVPEMVINGHTQERLPNTLNVTLPGLRGESMVLALDRKGVSLSSGSACRSGSPEPSHALLALGMGDEAAHCALRFSLGHGNTDTDIDGTLEILREVIRDSKTTVRFVPCR